MTYNGLSSWCVFLSELQRHVLCCLKVIDEFK